MWGIGVAQGFCSGYRQTGNRELGGRQVCEMSALVRESAGTQGMHDRSGAVSWAGEVHLESSLGPECAREASWKNSVP